MTGAAVPVGGMAFARSLAAPVAAPSPLTVPEGVEPDGVVDVAEFEGDEWWLDLGAGDA